MGRTFAEDRFSKALWRSSGVQNETCDSNRSMWIMMGPTSPGEEDDPLISVHAVDEEYLLTDRYHRMQGI